MNRWLLLLLAFPATCLAADRPKVLLILSDNQSYYEMGCHGHAQVKTPHIDQLQQEGVDFQNLYAPNYCSPSRAVLLTGQYAMRSGVHDTIGGRSILHRSKTTLADILSRHGYHTAIFGKWHLGFSYPHRPEDRGFQEVFIHGGGGVGQMEDYYGNTLFDTTFIHNGKVRPSKGYCTDTLFDRAIDYITARKDEPFFCFVSTPVTHSPHHGPRELVAQLKADGVTGNVELFAQIQNLDTNIGRLLARVDSLGLRKKTVVIYASDQGMSDRGAPHSLGKAGLGHDAKHHVPFMVRAPGVQPGINRRLAGMIDLFPTVLDYCGIEGPPDMDGMSLRPLVEGRASDYPAERTLVVQCPRGRTSAKWKNASVKTDRWRLVGEHQLFDAVADPRLGQDVADKHPEVVARLRAVYESYWKSLPDPATTLSRHVLGAKECPEVVLNGMDWYTGSRPWHRGHFNGVRGGNGAWPVTVQSAGRYSIECRHYPREAGKAMGATHARLKLGDIERKVAIEPSATHTTFEVELPVGEMDLQTWMTVGDKTRGALFVYIQKR